MGYTWYWNRATSRVISAKRWAPFRKDMERLFAYVRALEEEDKCRLLVAGHRDELTSFPVIDADAVLFNGYGPDGGHESFYFPRDGRPKPSQWEPKKKVSVAWDFCKTQRKAYDIYVEAALYLLHLHGFVKDYNNDDVDNVAPEAAQAVLIRVNEFHARKQLTDTP